MSRVMITGGAGFIGAHVARLLADHRHEVAIADVQVRYIDAAADTVFLINERYRHERLLQGIKVFRCDLCDAASLAGVFAEFRPTHVLHLAGMPLANLALRQPMEAFRSITVATANLLEIARQQSTRPQLTYVSSSMTYGDFQRCPIDEQARQDPKEIYGAMKLAGEQVVRAYGRCYQIPWSVVRPCSVYGPGDNNRRVVGLFLRRALEGRTLQVKNPDTTRLDFTHVDDLARGLCQVTLSPAAIGQAFNLTRGRARSLRELVQVIQQHHPQTQVEWVEGSTFRPLRGALDCAHARRLLGYRPEIDLESGVPAYSRFLQAALDGRVADAASFQVADDRPLSSRAA